VLGLCSREEKDVYSKLTLKCFLFNLFVPSTNN
jgi:hypothetical protein